MEDVIVRLTVPHQGYDGVLIMRDGARVVLLFGIFNEDDFAIDPGTRHEIHDITQAFYAPPEVRAVIDQKVKPVATREPKQVRQVARKPEPKEEPMKKRIDFGIKPYRG